MNSIVYAVIFALALAGFYALVYFINHRTPVPEGCENIKADCEGCNITSCGSHPTHDYTEEKV